MTYFFIIDKRGRSMAVVKVSPKFQVVIPKEIREQLALKPGQELSMYVVDGSIRLRVPGSLKSLRGIAKGMQWKEDYRDRNDRY
jgi:AbrB family looped-hinge helix DNA binding protein